MPCVGCRGLLTGRGGGAVGVFGDGEKDGIAAGIASLGTAAAVGPGVASGKERGEGVWEVLGGARQLDLPPGLEKPIIGI